MKPTTEINTTIDYRKIGAHLKEAQIPLDIHPRTGFQRLHRPVRKAIPRMNRVGFVNHLLLTVAVRMPQLTDDMRSVTRRGCLDKSENRAGKEKFVHG